MSDAPSALDDALLAARLCAVDPVGLGGLILRGGDALRDQVVAALRAGLPDGAPLRRIPVHVDDDALLGGLDLGATLALGRPVRQRGVLAAADGGLVVLPMAERMTEATAARIAAALDAGAVEDATVRIAVVALDDGVEGESVPPALVERLAFRIDLSGCQVSDVDASPAQAGAQLRNDGGMAQCAMTERCATGPRPSPGKEEGEKREGEKDDEGATALAFETDPSGNAASYVDASPAQAGAQSRNDGGMAKPAMTAPCAIGRRPSPGKEEGETRGGGKDDAETRNGDTRRAIDPHAILTATALALGVESARAPLFALRAARAAAALAGRETIDEDDLILAVRLVLAPRATRLPAPPKADNASDPPLPPPESNSSEEERATPDLPEDMILEAALATLPRDVLEQLAAGRGKRGGNRARGAGERRKSPLHGRPLGARAGVPRGGLRLSLIDTLRAAAPWQALRARGDGPVRIRRDDLRIRRFETRAESLTIFVVDASGSAAVARLAEAKGAVELLLAQAYVKRAQVALIAFRGAGAELLLPPTRSLTRARRALAELPGGGGTPLAAGLEAARTLAEAARARGRTPFLVVLTDGRGNIALDGSAVRERAEHDAEQAARAIGQAGIGAAFVDTSARPRPEGVRLALAMGARYLPLPRADAAAMHRAVSAVQAA
jgi:magnesium chelatase subunit D